jgi:WD40 repeat protein
MPVRLFLSYSRSDDEAFVRDIYESLKLSGFDVWFDRVSMPSRERTFSKEIEDAISACDRVVLIVGPSAASSDYVTHEWRFAFQQAVKCVNPILRLGDYDIIPEDLRGPHIEDFRDDSVFDFHLANLVRQLSDPLPPLGKLVAVPALPPHYLEQGDRIRSLRDMVLADLQKPVVISGASGRVGLHGMGGIGKSLLANALARRPEIRREFPDGVFWVTLGQQPLIVELQRNIAKELGDEALFTTAHAGRERLRELLKDRAALLVLDDAWQREHAEAFNVIGPRCRLLLTTRDAGLVTALAAKENHYQVQLPTEEEACAILAGASDIQVEPPPPEAREIVAECDRLPLALAICGGMVHGGTSWADLLEALREHDLRFLSDAHPGEEQHANIWKAIDVSIRVLPEDERKRFAELAVFALDTGAPEAAVETLWQHTAGLAPRYARKLLRDLAARSLVRLDAEKGRFTLHDLLHDFVTGMTADTASLHRILLEAYWKRCSNGWGSGPNDGYFLEHLRTHLCEAGRGDELADLLLELRWLEVKNVVGLAFDLLHDFSVAYDFLRADDERRRILGPLGRALGRDIHFIARHSKDYPQALFQSLWNTCWWYDCPEAEHYYDVPEGSVPPWKRDGSKLSRLLERWRAQRGASGGAWLRAIRPPIVPLGTPLQAVFRGHTGSVSGVTALPDGFRVATGSDDGTVRIWDARTSAQLAELRHDAAVLTNAVSPDGRYIATGSDDGIVRLWHLDTARLLRSFRGHEKRITSVDFSRDGKSIASASEDKSFILWNAESGELQRRVTEEGIPKAIAFTADGQVAVATQSRITLWNIVLEARQVLAQDLWIFCLACAPTAALLAVGDGPKLRVFDLRAGSELWQREMPWRRKEWGYDPWVLSIAFSADSSIVAAAVRESGIRIFDGSTGADRISLRCDSGELLTFGPSGHWIASVGTDEAVRIWDLFPTDNPTLNGHDRFIKMLVYSPDGKRLVTTGGDNMIYLWDSVTGRVLSRYGPWERGIWFVRYADEGRLIAGSAGVVGGGSVSRMWDAKTLKPVPFRQDVAIVPPPDEGDCRIRAVPEKNQTVIARDTGSEVAWYPVELQNLSKHPYALAWAGSEGSSLHLIAMESYRLP